MKKMNTHHMVMLAFLSAIATVLFMFEFPLPGSPLQFDLSDLPVLIGAVLYGPGAVIIIAFLKNVLHILFISKNSGLVGELANFVYAVSLALPLSLLVSQIKKHPKKRMGISIAIVVFSSLLMHLFNYYVTFPLYGLSQEGAWQMLNAIYLPFNLIKGSILMILLSLIKPVFHQLNLVLRT